MAGNKNFSQTIQYKGQLDVSQIISSLQKIRNELANSSTLKGKDSLFINVDKEMKNIENLSAQLKAAIQKGFSNPKDVKDFERIVNSLDKSFNKVAVDLNGINANKLTQKLRSATEELNKQKNILKDTIALGKENISRNLQDSAKKYTNSLVQSAKAGQELKTIQEQITKELDEQIAKQEELRDGAQKKVNEKTKDLNTAKHNAYKTSFKINSFNQMDENGKAIKGTRPSSTEYEKIKQIFKEVVSNEKTAEKAVEKFNKELKKLGFIASDTAIKNVSESFNKIQTSVKPAGAALKTAEAELQKVKKAIDQMTQQKGAVGSITNSQEIVSSYQKIVAAVNSVAQAENNVNAARGKMGSQIPEMQRYATLMNQYRGATQQATQQVGELTEQQQRFDSTFDHLTRYIQYTFSLANGFRMLRQVVQKTFNDVKELDAAFASIAMVTDYSVEQMWSSYDDYAEMANRLGQTTKDVIASSALFYQQGLDTAEALELTESTMKLATLAGSDFETATSQMTAALRGFNMEMDEGERITDVYSELAAKAAADVDGIAYAMSKTASIAASAGMEFETTSAFLTQMIETTQEAPENIGTAMKTIIARFTELKENVAGTADSEFEDLDYNKVDTALKSVGVSLKDASGQFRDLDDVFLELAEKWNTLDRNSQRYIATIAAGSRQQSRFIAMMEDYDRTVELIDTAYNSAGRSSEQFAKYQDTVEYKLKQLSNTWEQLRTGFLDSDTYKGLIDFANKALGLISKMDLKQILTVGTIGLTLGRTIITDFINGIKNSTGQLKTAWRTTLQQVFDTKGKSLLSLTGFKQAFNDLTSESIIDSQKYIANMSSVLGAKTINAPQLELGVEAEKTLELQKQLSVYTQLEQKRKSLVDQARLELSTGNGINQQTREQLNETYLKEQEKIKYLNNLLKELGYEKEITTENAKQLLQDMEQGTRKSSKSKFTASIQGAGTSALSTGITSALMMAISGADLSTIIKTAGTSALMAAIPSIISAVAPTLIHALLSPIGLVGIAVGAFALIGYEIDKYQKKIEENQRALERMELNRLKNVEEANKNLQDDQLNAIKNMHSVQKERQNIEDLQERYGILSNKSFLTESEQTELNEIVENLTNNYDELVLSFDENTNEIQFNTVAIEKLNETLTNEEDYYKLNEKAAGGLQVFNTSKAFKKERDLISDISNEFLKYKLDYVQTGNVSAFSGNDVQYGIKISSHTGEGKAIGNTAHTVVNPSETDIARTFSLIAPDAVTVADSVPRTTYSPADSFLGNRDDIKLFVENINSLNETIKNNLGLDSNKIYNPEEFQQWFLDKYVGPAIEDPENFTNTNFQQNFLDDLNKAYEETELAERQNQLFLDNIKTSVSNSYKSYEVAGEQIGEELANDLAAGVDNIDSAKVSSEYEKYNLGQKTEGLFSEIVEGDLAGIAGRNASGNITSNDVEDAFIAMGFVDENYELDLEKYKKNFENVQNFIDNIESLPEQYQEFLENTVGIDNIKNIDISTEDGRQKVKDIVEDSLQIYIASLNTDFANISEEVLSQNTEQITAYNKLQEEAPTLTKQEYETRLQAILSQISDTQLKSALETANSLNETTGEIVNKNAKSYEESIKKFRSLGILNEKEVSGLSLGAQTSILDIVSKSNLSGQSQKDFTKNLVDTYNNLKPATQNVLGSIDLINSSYSQLLISADEYIKGIAETGEYSINEATKIYMDYIETASSYLNKVVLGEAGAQVLKDQYNDHLKSIKEDFSSLIEAQNEFIENGTLSSETYFQLLKDGFGNYVKITENGYELIADAMEKAFVDQSMVPLKSLQKQIDKNKELLSLSKSIPSQFTFYDKNNGNKYEHNIDEILQQVTNGSMDAFNQLEPEIQEYILAIKEAGYVTETSFVKALEEGTVALEQMEPETWIQGLVSITETVVDADEKIEDLNEELEDLNKQLEEDKAALAEAEDELRQAIHGSDDFQSSLDGLVNYTEKIERLDKAIEKTKEALEDVSDVDEAKGLMAQLNEQYDSKTISLGAENMAIDAALENLRSTLTENYGDYISFDEEGNPLIDFAYMTMDANDEIRKAFEEEYNLYNEYRDKQTNNLDAIAEIEKAKQEQREQALQNFVSIQEDVISILKEKAQEEIDVTKEKYDALEEADNDYLDALQDAIDKQRELRDKQNQYEDLATKEKKLSLLQRDTSGANQKEVLTLQNEIEDDRQNLLDSEIDSMIESMKELYEKQKEARDAEIEYMEEVTEDTQYFAEWASNIMSTWQSAEDMQTWYLENDPNAQDMTVEQTEVYLNEIGDKYSDYVQYVATLATDFTTEQEELNAAMNEMYENTSTNVENIGTVTQDLAQAAADKAIEEATKARDDAKDKLEETQKKIDETTEKLKAAEDTAVQKHEAAMNAMVEASQSGMLNVSTYATEQLIKWSGLDINDQAAVTQYAKDLGMYNEEQKAFDRAFISGISSQGGDTSYMKSNTTEKGFTVKKGYAGNYTTDYYDTYEEAEKAAREFNSANSLASATVGAASEGIHGYEIQSNGKAIKTYAIGEKTENGDTILTSEQAYQEIIKEYSRIRSKTRDAKVVAFEHGGLVNYTGPAWVDGTPTKPEAFLNAEDTERIGNAAKILADIPLLNSTSLSENAISSNIGDTSIEIHINVESISSDYDVDQMIERVKNDIIDVSKPVGTSVILKK